MKNKLNEAFDNIDLKYAKAAENPPKKSRALKIALIAAALALVTAAVPVISVMSRRNAANDTLTEGVETGLHDGKSEAADTGATPAGLDGAENNDTTPDGAAGGELSAPGFAGKAGDYSGAKYVSLAAYPENDETLYGRWNEYTAESAKLAGFFDRLYQTVLGKDGASVVSPVNIYTALSLLAECTDGNTRRQILDAVGVSDMDGMRAQSKLIWESAYRDNEYGKTLLGNSVWLSTSLPVKEKCVKLLNDEHYASVFNGDFYDDKYVSAMKQWISDQTGGLLDKQLSELDIPPETVAALVSTLYYKARWENGFTGSADGIFYGKNGEQNCKFNQKKSVGQIYKENGFTAYREKLSDGNYMWFFLPDEDKTVSDVLDYGAVSYINQTKKNGKLYDVTFLMPDFDVDCDATLNDAFKALGIKDCFGSADFSPLTDASVRVDRVQHAARVKADKDGVEGAAYTVMLLERSGDFYGETEEYTLTLDRPFVFIVENGGVPLFVGCVNDLQ